MKRLLIAFWIMGLLSASAGAQPQAVESPNREALVELGKALFFDTTLSNPKGQSCASCHAPEAGWTYPDSDINTRSGIASGAVSDRYGSRRPPTIGYLKSMASSGPVYNKERGTFASGFFYDGRAASLVDQISGPLLNPNEMNNTKDGVVQTVLNGGNAVLFRKAFGTDAAKMSVEDAFNKVVRAIAEFEMTKSVSPSNSTYDAYVAGKVDLTPSQMAGLQLFTGSKSGRPGGPAVKSAGCWSCHTVEESAGGEPDLFTSSTFHNIGIPRNPANPYYLQTDATKNPLGHNPLGDKYVDYGLGNYLYPRNSLPPGNTGEGSNGRGDYLRINGKFKTPTVRNVDTRPSPAFVKAYGHNGYFKSLEQVVQFYNSRNLTTKPDEVINFTERDPYARLQGTPLWPRPEVADPATLANPTGMRGQIGNLGLTPTDVANLVAFLQALSDKPEFVKSPRPE